jgi:hypothetical protein
VAQSVVQPLADSVLQSLAESLVQSVADLRRQMMFLDLLNTTDQGIVENAVAASGIRAQGSGQSVVLALKGEGRHGRNRDTGKHNLTLIIDRVGPTGDEYGPWLNNRHPANANESFG